MTTLDAVIACGIVIVVGGFIYAFWRPLILQSLCRDLARIDHPRERMIHTIFMLLMGLVVALSMYRLGALLVPALMVLPAACARMHARSPHGMITVASIIGGIGCIMGAFGSFYMDTPLSPTIVLSLALLGGILYTGSHISFFVLRKAA